MKRIKGRADVILTVSEFSKSEIVKLYDVDSNKIKVAHLGYDKSLYNESVKENVSVLEKYQITKPYLLYVGRIEKKKNVLNIVKAFSKVSADYPDLRLILAGGQGNQYDTIFEFIQKNNLSDKVFLPGYIDESDLPYLFKSAEVFLFPTLYEGFGIPILQAMAVGTVVVTSKQNPHQEVAGEAAVYVNAKDHVDIAEGIKRTLTQKEKLIAKGLERVKQFSWESLAKNILSSLIETRS